MSQIVVSKSQVPSSTMSETNELSIPKPKVDRELLINDLREYSKQIDLMARKYDIPVEGIYAKIHTESSANPSAKSPSGAVGLMQIMPSTFRDIKKRMLRDNPEEASRIKQMKINKASDNIEVGAYFRSHLLSVYQHLNTPNRRYGDMLATLAYNMGAGTLQKYLDKYRSVNVGKSIANFIDDYKNGKLFGYKLQTESNYVQSAQYVTKFFYYESEYGRMANSNRTQFAEARPLKAPDYPRPPIATISASHQKIEPSTLASAQQFPTPREIPLAVKEQSYWSRLTDGARESLNRASDIIAQTGSALIGNATAADPMPAAPVKVASVAPTIENHSSVHAQPSMSPSNMVPTKLEGISKPREKISPKPQGSRDLRIDVAKMQGPKTLFQVALKAKNLSPAYKDLSPLAIMKSIVKHNSLAFGGEKAIKLANKASSVNDFSRLALASSATLKIPTQKA